MLLLLSLLLCDTLVWQSRAFTYEKQYSFQKLKHGEARFLPNGDNVDESMKELSRDNKVPC